VLKYAALSFADIVLIAGWKGHLNAKKWQMSGTILCSIRTSLRTEFWNSFVWFCEKCL